MKLILPYIKDLLKKSTVLEYLIYAFIAIFILGKLLFVLRFFTNISPSISHSFMLENFTFSAKPKFYMNIYAFFTYGFLHSNFVHLLINSIVLHFIGTLFLDYFSQSKLLIYFIFGSIFGALFFHFSYNYFEVFKNKEAFLLGSSAGITAIMVGIATHIPNYDMHFNFLGYIKLWILTTIWIVLSFILIPYGNGGGQIAHLGGAFLGFILTKYFNYLEEKEPKYQPKSKLKTVYKKPKKLLTNHQKDNLKQRKIDALLDKISKSGYEVLTATEKEFLDSVSNN